MKRVWVLVMIAAVFPAKSLRAEAPPASRISDDTTLRDRCGGVDGGLDKVARVLAARRIGAMPALDQSALTSALREAGAPYVWPQSFIASAKDEAGIDRALARWMTSVQKSGTRRCGVARGRAPNGEIVLAAVAVDALANLAPLAMHSHVGSWLTVDSQLLVPATDARAVIIEPDGSTRRLLASFSDGRLLARFAPDRSGTFTVQVVADVDGGPRPVLEARVTADEPSGAISADAAADASTCGTGADANSFACMIQSFRSQNRLDRLVRDARLDALAQAHALRMKGAQNVAHDVGDGDPVARLDDANLRATAVGENVAHTQSILGAHRSLCASPSHRDNLLSTQFDRFGVGVVTDDDGSVWVVEEFAAGLK